MIEDRKELRIKAILYVPLADYGGDDPEKLARRFLEEVSIQFGCTYLSDYVDAYIIDA